MIKDQFFVRWNYHLLTSPGYVLLMTNYTGSTGYGEEFAAAIHKDILRGRRPRSSRRPTRPSAQFPFIDGSRQAAIGGKLRRIPDELVRGQHEALQMPGESCGSDGQRLLVGRHRRRVLLGARNGGPVWERKGAWREQSPSAYAANFSTPMLITHGEQDFRVPINQAFEIYKLLQRRSVPTRLVIFPDASHWVLKGEDARQHMREVLDWIKKYI